MNYRSITDFKTVLLKKLHIVPRDIDLIVGIPRSGMLPANLLALYLNLPYTDIHSLINGYIYKSGSTRKFFDTNEYKKVLVIDDSIGSGEAMNRAKEELKPVIDQYHFTFCAVYSTPEKQKMVDFIFEVVPIPRYFEWNIFNNKSLKDACFDIDGVLCPDPLPEQNDDGEKYIDFITNAPALYIPKTKVGAIVTSRLEKYRPHTEAWLKKNGVSYHELIMLDLPDMKARQNAGNHGLHKALAYQRKPYKLFIESELRQAMEINAVTKKPVFCTENFEMVYHSESLIYNVKSGKYFPLLRKTALKLRDKLRKARG